MIVTYMEAEQAGEGERLALLIGEGLQHQTFQLRVTPLENFWAVELTGTDYVVPARTPEIACTLFNDFVEQLRSTTETCLVCGGTVVFQKGSFTRDMTSGEVLETLQLQSERCHACGSPHLSYRNK